MKPRNVAFVTCDRVQDVVFGVSGFEDHFPPLRTHIKHSVSQMVVGGIMRRVPHRVYSMKSLDKGTVVVESARKFGRVRKVVVVSAVLLCFVHWWLSRTVDVPVGCSY